MSANVFSGMSRRQFLVTTAAAAVATSLPLRAQYVSPTAQYTRISLTDPGAPAMLDSYATAIKALLKLPPTDPRNFYRNAFIHTLDCPHGNWWFLPRHRGYLGWWEQLKRQSQIRVSVLGLDGAAVRTRRVLAGRAESFGQ
jgi:tyrosinase